MKNRIILTIGSAMLIGSFIFPETSIGRQNDMLKVTTLAENRNKDHTNLASEFGFSVLIEKGNKKIIFDTAKTGIFIKNAKLMNVDLSDTDCIILSHAHYDHCGGMIPYLKEYGAKKTILYVKNTFFNLSDKKYYHDKVGQKFDFTNGKPGYFPVGINFILQDLTEKEVKINFINQDSLEMDKGIIIHGNFKNDAVASFMLVKDGENYKTDDFDEEIALSIETDKGLVIISGCSHTGILNIVQTINKRTGKKIYAVIGGFHLLDASDEKIQSTINRFRELGIEKIGLSHCTGPKATKMFSEQMPDRTFINETGSIFIIGND